MPGDIGVVRAIFSYLSYRLGKRWRLRGTIRVRFDMTSLHSFILHTILLHAHTFCDSMLHADVQVGRDMHGNEYYLKRMNRSKSFAQNLDLA
jgi:tRNA A37 methylthiotransferase MiaB